MKTEAEATADLSTGIPTANAGPDKTVDEGQTVTLDGSASSDPDGTIVSYEWTQTGEPQVTLSDPASPTPSFTAPDMNSNEIYLTFQLTVTDDSSQTGTDTCVIHIKDAVFEDTDNDGMSDTWEMKHFGTLDKDGTGDADQDGISDLDEYLNGTGPVTGEGYILTIKTEPADSGTTIPEPGTHTYTKDTLVNIEAVANTGYRFDHWTGEVADTTSPATTVTMDSEKTVIALFTALEHSLGDADGDGEIDIFDALLIAEYSVGLWDDRLDLLIPDFQTVADIDGNGAIDINDALEV